MERSLMGKQWIHELRGIHSELYRILNTFYQPFGLTSSQAVVLQALSEREPQNITDLSQSLQLGKSSLSTLCQRLEKMELLRRERDQEDQRVVYVSLTEKAWEIIREVNKQLIPLYFSLLSSFSNEEEAVITQGLDLLHRHLQSL